MPAVLVTGLLLRRTRSFFPTSGRDHRQYSLRLPTEGWPGWVGLGGLVKYQDVCEGMVPTFADIIGPLPTSQRRLVNIPNMWREQRRCARDAVVESVVY